MPFYEYQCTECGHTLEEMEKITAAPLKICPECGKPALQRLMGHAYIHTTLVYIHLTPQDVFAEYARAVERMAQAAPLKLP